MAAIASSSSFTRPFDKFYVLKQGNKSLSIVESNRHYVVGFKSAMMARKVHYNLRPDPVPDMRIERGERVDVTREVKQGLEALGHHSFASESVCIDTRALLFVPKYTTPGSAFDPQHDAGVHLSTMASCDFLMYPFEHNLGVIMPYELLHERPHEFVFRSHVIDPSIDPLLFARVLSSKM
jgi:hypothetical protein